MSLGLPCYYKNDEYASCRDKTKEERADCLEEYMQVKEGDCMLTVDGRRRYVVLSAHVIWERVEKKESESKITPHALYCLV